MWHTVFVVVALLAGIGLIAIARYLHQPATTWRDIGTHMIRDLGIALVVAVAVGYGFEIYQRARETEHTMAEAFDARMSDELTRDVWLGVKHQILEKRLLRREADIRLRLQRKAGLPTGQAALAVEFAYDLYSLSDAPLKMTVEHELDYQFAAPAQQLPRFERIVVDDRSSALVYEGENLRKIVHEGAVRIPIELRAKASSSTRIEVARMEITNVPGSYNLYMTEYTKGVRIHVDDCPDDIEIEVRVRPEGNAEQARKAGTVWYLDALLLPGQGIEIKFKKRVR